MSFPRDFGRIILFVAFITVSVAVYAASPSQHAEVPMKDGTKLSTDIYFPKNAGEGPWPAVLVRSTYGRYFTSDGFAERCWRELGFVTVLQDTRGLGTSEGEHHVFFYDGWRPGLNDGADTVAWIKAQPWCNGKIGTYGGSALAMTQMLLAPTTSDVTAQCVEKVPSNFYFEVVYPGGVYRHNLVEGWLLALNQTQVVPVYKSHPLFDEFWGYYNTIAQTPKMTAPAFFLSGWYDIFQQGALNGFMEREKNGGPGAKGNNYLYIGPGTHNKYYGKEYKFRKNGPDISSSDIRGAFLDYHLNGNQSALDGIAKVNYFVLGPDKPADAPGNFWRSADTWPPFDAAPTPYYLHNDGTLSTAAPAEPEASQGFTFDPKDPYPTYGGANLFYNIQVGPYDQRKYSTTRTDLLKFVTAPMDNPMEVTGHVFVKLYISTDAPDTDFTAKLVDIYPTGDEREIILLDMIQRVKMRESCTTPAPLLTGPDQIIELNIDMWSISWIAAPGHRIGLHISSSNYPRFEVNANTGADHPELSDELRVAHNRVHLDASHPSALLLPVRPAE